MGGFLLSLLSKLNSLWKCSDQRFGLRSPSLTYIDRRSGERRSPPLIWVGFGRRSTSFFFRQCLDNDPRSTPSTTQAKNRQFCSGTVRLEPWSNGHGRILSRTGQAWKVLCVAAWRGPMFDPACVHYSHAYMYMYDSRATSTVNTNRLHWSGFFVRFELRDQFPDPRAFRKIVYLAKLCFSP